MKGATSELEVRKSASPSQGTPRAGAVGDNNGIRADLLLLWVSIVNQLAVGNLISGDIRIRSQHWCDGIVLK